MGDNPNLEPENIVVPSEDGTGINFGESDLDSDPEVLYVSWVQLRIPEGAVEEEITMYWQWI